MSSLFEQLAEQAHLFAGAEPLVLPPRVRELLRGSLLTLHRDASAILTTAAPEVVLEGGMVPAPLLELSGLMVAVCKQFHGQGLAAPQVGKSLRLLIWQSTVDHAWYAMLNPTLVRHGRDAIAGLEGCLSLPGLKVLVSRWHLCEVEGISWKVTPEVYHGLPVTAVRRRWNLRGPDARCLQHELDHLDGILVTMRAQMQKDAEIQRLADEMVEAHQE